MKRKLQEENYHHNINQKIESQPYLTTGLITKQNKLTNWRYGKYTSNYNGCGWIAIANATELLHNPIEPAEVIRWLDAEGVLKGLVLNGKYGTYPWTVKTFFKALGYKVARGWRRKKREQVAFSYDIGVAFYITKGRGHFVAFQKNGWYQRGIPMYQFYNDIHGSHEDLRTLEQFFDDNHAKIRMVTGINIKEKLPIG